MECLDENAIAGYLAGTLPRSEVDHVEAHLDFCADCRALVSELSRRATRHGARERAQTPTGATVIRWPAAPGPQVEIEAGDVIAGKYRFERVIGGGAMGVVIAATHLDLAQLVALKFMNPAMLGHDQGVVRFRREARAVARLRNEHVGRVLDLGTLDSGEPYIVMEYLEGEDLDARLDREATLPDLEAVDLVLQACEAVAEAHRMGIVHRDLKPANLFLTHRSDGDRSVCLKVLDFGLSKVFDDDPMITDTHVLLGTPLYTAPEQLESAREVDGRADIWSLGVILYRMLAGTLPYQARTLGTLMASVQQPPPTISSHGVSVSPALEAIVLRCLSRDPASRFQTIDGFARALSAWRTGASRPVAPTPLRSRRRRGVAIAILATVIGGSAGVWMVAQLVGDPPRRPVQARDPAPPPPRASVAPSPADTDSADAASVADHVAIDAGAVPAPTDQAAVDPHRIEPRVRARPAHKREPADEEAARSKKDASPTRPIGDDDILEPTL